MKERKKEREREKGRERQRRIVILRQREIVYACESPIKSWKLRELCEWVRKYERKRERERE